MARASADDRRGAGGSSFSPFNLYFGEVSTFMQGNRDEAMKGWNDLDPETREEFVRRSNHIKEALKTSARQAESCVPTDSAFENFERLESIIKSDGGMLRRSMKLITVQYSANFKASTDSGIDETRYIPNEISVLTFSFVGGIESERHFFIQLPEGDVPSYCQAEMKDRFEEYHHIPFDPDEICQSGLAPIARTAKDALEDMFHSCSRDEMMTFCLSEDRDVLHGSVKTLITYVPNQDDAREFKRRSIRVFDFEDLLPFLLPRSEESRDQLVSNIKDRLADDVQMATRCRCDFHRDLEETEVHCTLLRAHSALHMLFDTSAQDLRFTLTRRHLDVPERRLKKCSSSFFAEFPEQASEEDQIIWSKYKAAAETEDSNQLEEDSPRKAQIRFLQSLRDPDFAGEVDTRDEIVEEDFANLHLVDGQSVPLDRGDGASVGRFAQQSRIGTGAGVAPRSFGRGGRGRGFAPEDDTAIPPGIGRGQFSYY